MQKAVIYKIWVIFNLFFQTKVLQNTQNWYHIK